MSDDLHLDLLDQIQIASPCPARWEDMEGDEKSRLCGQCSLKVHNFSAMTRDEAYDLLTRCRHGERLCAQIARRADGCVVTAEDLAAQRTVIYRIRGMLGRAAVFLFGATAAGWIAGCVIQGKPMGGSLVLPECRQEGEATPDAHPCEEPSDDASEILDESPEQYPVALGILDP